MRCKQLIVQLPITDALRYEALLRIEETLIQAFAQNNVATVDGHDFGQGKFNLFIFPRKSWASAIERVLAFLELRGVLNQALIVKHAKDSDRYVVVWPRDRSIEFEL